MGFDLRLAFKHEVGKATLLICKATSAQSGSISHGLRPSHCRRFHEQSDLLAGFGLYLGLAELDAVYEEFEGEVGDVCVVVIG